MKAYEALAMAWYCTLSHKCPQIPSAFLVFCYETMSNAAKITGSSETRGITFEPTMLLAKESNKFIFNTLNTCLMSDG